MIECNLDPATIEACWSNEDVEDLWYEPEPRDTDLEQMREIVTRLTPRMQEVYILRFQMGKVQKDIAEVIGVSQAAIHKIINEIVERIKLVKDIPHTELITGLPPMIQEYIKTGSYAETGRRLGLSRFAVYKYVTKFRNGANADVKELLDYVREMPSLIF